MMNRLHPLQQITEELYDLLEREVTGENRDEVIDETGRFLDERDIRIREVKPPYSADEQATGKELVRLDSKIQHKLALLFEAVKTDVKMVKQKKKSNASYAKPYQQTANYDGMFLDHKK